MDNESLNGFTGFSQVGNGNFQYTRSAQEQRIPVEFSQQELADLEPTQIRWAWYEVDLGAIRHNVLEARRHLKPSCHLMAIVKADGYGHGANECARVALAAGASHLGVATVEEAVSLRDAGFTAPILVLSEPPQSSIPVLLARTITPALFTPEFALVYGEIADQHGMVGPYHLAVNTGMNRIGVRAEEARELYRQIGFHRGLELEGVFTHFATADMPENIDFRMQLKRFNECIASLRDAGIDPGIVHAANSAAIFRYPEAHFDMVRLGISLCGYHPCPETLDTVNLRPAMSVKARITDVKSVPMSEGVSYGLHYRGRSGVRICTVPIGYADGLRRNLSGDIDFILDGQYCPQVGSICMDQCMFEVDLRSSSNRARLDPQVGDVVTIVGEQGNAVCTVTEMARKLGTIEHEVAIGFSHRLPRVFVE